MNKAACLVVATGLVAFPALARAQAPTEGSSPAPPPRRVEARAEEQLKKMSEFLAKASRFAVEAEETFTEVANGEPKVELTNVRRVAVERPSRLAADATGDTLNRAAWYDGRSVTVLDKEHNVYVTVEGAATIDATLDKLQDEYGISLPFADIFYSDPYAVLMEDVTYGRYLGLHLAAGVLCHHLVFAQPTIEWQIWIDAGDEPLLRKFVITYVQEPGEPQYTAVVRRWALSPTFPESLFTFEAPEGATKIDAKAIARKPNGGDASPEDRGAKGGQR